MSDTLPVFSDSEGLRWARVSAKEFARAYPDHETCVLVAESQNVAASPADAARLRDWLTDGAARLYLKGDAYHANDWYDITESVRNALNGTDIERDDLMRRLYGRHVLRTAVERAKRPNWWTDGLAVSLNELVASADVDGVVLGDDWSPDFDPEYPAYPWVPDLATHVDEFQKIAGWLFETGEPSVYARYRVYAALRTWALDNLASLATTGRRLGVAFPMNRQRQWWFSPWAVARRGLVPFLTTTLPMTLDALTGSEMMRISEAALTPGTGIRSRFVASRVSNAVLGWVAGAGLALEAKRVPHVDLRGRPRSDVLVLAAREDGWAHGWDEATPHLLRVTGRLIETLSAKGVSYAVADESNLPDVRTTTNPSVILVAPCRNVASETVASLTEWVDGGGYLGFAEPCPYLVNGERSTTLDTLLLRRRVRRWEPGGNDKTLNAILRRTQVRPVFDVFDRVTGEPLTHCYRHTIGGRDTERMDTFAVSDAATNCALVELDGDWLFVKRWRNGIVPSGEPIGYWRADGRTYIELPMEREVVYTLNSISLDEYIANAV
jgi:hypothetical protein